MFSSAYKDYELSNEYGGIIFLVGGNTVVVNKNDRLYVYNSLLMLNTSDYKRLFPTYNVKEIRLNKEHSEEIKNKKESTEVEYHRDN